MNFKIFTVVVLINIYATSGISQIEKYNGVWIHDSDYRGLIIKDGKSISLEDKDGRDLNAWECTIFNDTLRCVVRSIYKPYGKEEWIKRVKEYDFKLLNYRDTSWQLKPISSESIRLFGHNSPRTYTRQENIPITNLNFEKIIYHQRPYSLEIDSSKAINLRITTPKENITSDEESDYEVEYFTVVLDELQFQNLLNLLSVSKLDKLTPKRAGSYSHIPYKSFIVFLNGSKKRFSYQKIPIVMQMLNDFLVSICRNNGFDKSDSTYDFKRW